jgi:hypothetical protein
MISGYEPIPQVLLLSRPGVVLEGPRAGALLLGGAGQHFHCDDMVYPILSEPMLKLLRDKKKSWIRFSLAFENEKIRFSPPD